jgi:predicted TIM-barrel fold metal-dependent hydrolase
VSTLEAPVNAPSAACVPAINFHTHLGRWLTQKAAWMEPDLGRLLDLMGSHNISALVNLDGRWGRELEDNLDRYDRAYPGRFYTFCHVDWRLLEKPRGPELLAESLGRSVAAGARGLKVWKDLGMQVTVRGRTILPDDDMLGPLWEAAGELGVPVLIHVGDPVAFFQPVDRQNERLEELLRHPGGSRAHTGPDELRGLLSSVEHLVASHPKTTVVAAHGFHPEDLAHVSAMMDRYENFFIDIAWAHLQLGRQPRAARDLITKHPGRVLFGTDVFPLRTGIFPIYFRFLETVDESFSYTDEPVPGSGRWPIYGLGLDHATLEQVYRANACKLLGLPPPH